MPERSNLWIWWRVFSTIAVAVLGLLVHFFTKSGTTYNSLPGYLIDTEGCRIPDLYLYDPSIRQFIYDEKNIMCQETYGMALVESNLTALFINESALSYYNITDINDLSCCYTPFWRVEMDKNENGEYPKEVDSLIRFAQTCTYFSGQVRITDEFVKTECFLNSSSSNNSIYTDFHAFTPIKTNVIREVPDPLKNTSISVLIIGVDTVSRLNLHRQMPLTVNFLKKNLSAVEFLGYNKVADNTFPNLIPVLTGESVEELKQSCWPSGQSVFDDCNFIWDRFSAAGYTTAFAEDASWMSIFSDLTRGFRKQPTDYYPRPFVFQAEKDIGHDQRRAGPLCVGPRKGIEVLLNYAHKFSITMKEVLSFSFIWGIGLGHDYLNLPKQGDGDHKKLLEALYKETLLERTVLVFMSDHGYRFGAIRQTYQGSYEERLPFLFIAYPNWFKQKYPTAIGHLKKNAQKLTTPFDLHETLLDLINLTRLETEVLKVRSDELGNGHNLTRGISLFLSIPGKRTCSDAGIDGHWCTCHSSVSVPTSDNRVKSAANYVVDHINSLVKDNPQCARLTLRNITNARQERATHMSFAASDEGLTDFSLTIETVPGKGLFESTVRYNENTKRFLVLGSVSRINLYGNQSSCTSNFRTRLYCYCT